jgi:hypothetical protein
MCILCDKMDVQQLRILVTNRVSIGVYSFIWIQLNSNFKVETWNNCDSCNYFKELLQAPSCEDKCVG